MQQITIIVPVFNEADIVLPFYYELKKHLAFDFELLWIDDGSTDATIDEIEELILRDDRIKCISLTKNFGQVNAISAGLDFANAGTIVIMNGDLKHPPSLIPQMLSKINDGYEIANAVSTTQAKTFLIQRKLLDLYYRFLNRVAPDRNKNDLTAFRAFNISVTEGIHQVKENNLLLSNFFNWAGYKSTTINFDCAKCSKKTKLYSLSHLINQTKMAWFQFKPEASKSLFVTGVAITVFSLVKSFDVIHKMTVNSQPVNNLVIILLSVFFLGGIQLMIQSKYRKVRIADLQKANKAPQYIIKDIIEQEKTAINYRMELRN